MEVLKNTIPLLHKNGITRLGVEFALYSDQDTIDTILTAPNYDEDAVFTLLFNRMVIWGYQEYADIFRSAWKVNQNLRKGEKPFRIVGLNVRQYWEFFQSEKDMKKPEVLQAVFADGVPDVHMAEVVAREFLNKGEKALVFTSLQHAFTDHVVQDYAENAEEMGLDDTRRLGRIIHEKAGDRVGTIIMHAPWPNDRAQFLAVHPMDAVLEKLVDSLDEERYYFGFFTADTPFGELGAGRNDFTKGYAKLTLADMCDGYIVTGPIGDYLPVTPIPDFINDNNLPYTIQNFPGATPENATEEDMNTYISNLAESRGTFLEKF